jgi:sirohydrochlorin ferrochelatase
MTEITVIENEAADLAEFFVVGAVSADEIIDIAQYHPGFRMRKHLVDMTETELHLLDSSSLAQIANAFREVEHGRFRGRTAIVVSSAADAIIPKLFAAISTGSVSRQEVFKITLSRDEALSWLSENVA